MDFVLNLNPKSIYVGEGYVWHSRRRDQKTRGNGFRYGIYNFLVPILPGGLPHSIKGFTFQGKKYLEGKHDDLYSAITQFLAEHLGYSASQVWLQTLPEVFGYAFNPVSFWYLCKDEKLDAVLCEVNNTFGDRHFYFLNQLADPKSFLKPKEFHVSPFLQIAGNYHFDFKFSDLSNEVKITLTDGEQIKLQTGIGLQFQAFAETTRTRLLRKYGWLTVMVMLRIHSQALKLYFLKKAQFFQRPQPPQTRITR